MISRTTTNAKVGFIDWPLSPRTWRILQAYFVPRQTLTEAERGASSLAEVDYGHTAS